MPEKVAELIVPLTAPGSPEFSLCHSDRSGRGLLTPVVCLLGLGPGKKPDQIPDQLRPPAGGWMERFWRFSTGNQDQDLQVECSRLGVRTGI
jgi:hypothetical protein